MTIFVIIRLTELVNKIITKSNIRRIANQIKHRLAVITYQKQICDVVVLDTDITIDRTGLVSTSFSVTIGPVYHPNKTAIFNFPDVRVVCHVSVYHVICLSRAEFICGAVFSWFARLSFDLAETKSKFGYLRHYRQMSAAAAAL